MSKYLIFFILMLAFGTASCQENATGPLGKSSGAKEDNTSIDEIESDDKNSQDSDTGDKEAEEEKSGDSQTNSNTNDSVTNQAAAPEPTTPPAYVFPEVSLKLIADSEDETLQLFDNDNSFFLKVSAAEPERLSAVSITFILFEQVNCQGTSLTISNSAAGLAAVTGENGKTYSFKAELKKGDESFISPCSEQSLTIDTMPPQNIAGHKVQYLSAGKGSVKLRIDLPVQRDDYDFISVRRFQSVAAGDCQSGDEAANYENFEAASLEFTDENLTIHSQFSYAFCIQDHAGNQSRYEVNALYPANPGFNCHTPPCSALGFPNEPGSFTEYQIGTSVGTDKAANGTKVKLVDIDNDNDLDLLVTLDDTPSWSHVQLANSNGTFAETAYNPGDQTGAVIDLYAARSVNNFVADLNNDGYSDIIFYENKVGDNRIRIYMNDGDRSFTFLPLIYIDDDNSMSDLGIADFNGDGYLDLVIGLKGTRVNLFMFGQGDGSFDDSDSMDGDDKDPIGSDTYDTQDIAVGDFDLDGNVDFVCANNGSANRVYLGQGDGTFAAGIDVEAGQSNATLDIHVGDFNSDGIPDLVALNTNQPNRVYLGVGDGTFTFVGNIHGGSDDVRESELADLNADGNLDIVLAVAGSPLQLFLGQGDGSFAAGSNITSTNIADPWGIAIGDINADGYPDITAGHWSGPEPYVYLGQP